jgi:hypothetical protein
MFLKSLTLAALVSVSSGCITYQEQTIAYRHDTIRNSLDVYSIYTGIHGDGTFSGEEDLPMNLAASEEDQLRSTVLGQRIFFFETGFACSTSMGSGVKSRS